MTSDWASAGRSGKASSSDWLPWSSPPARGGAGNVLQLLWTVPSGWIARALGEAETDRAAIDAHLEMCTRCRQRLDEFERVVGMLHETQWGSAPVHVLTALLERQRHARSHASRVPGFLRPLPAIAAALAAIALFGGGFATGRRSAVVSEPAAIEATAKAPRPTSPRTPLPTPPRLAIEPAIASAGDLALATRIAAGSQPAGSDTTAHDSL